MSVFAPGVVINNIQPPPVMYGVSAEDFQFSFSVRPDWEIDSDGILFFNIGTVCVSQFGSQYMLSCVAPTGAFVVAGDILQPIVKATPSKSETTKALAGLRAVVRAIRDSQALATSPSFDELLTRAVQSRGTPKDIKEWANRLAGDVGELVD